MLCICCKDMLQGHEQICIRGKEVDIHGNTNLALHSTAKLWLDGWMNARSTSEHRHQHENLQY